MSGGQLITVGQGTLRAASGGQVIVSGQGILTASGTPFTVNLSGVEAEFLSGSVVYAGQQLVGSAATLSAGSFGKSWTKEITGNSITAGIGTMVPGIEADDTYISSGQGNFVSNFNIAISGIESTMGQGTVIFSRGNLTGSVATFSQQSFPAFIIARALTGQSITVSQGTITQVGGTTPVDPGVGGSGTRRRITANYQDNPNNLIRNALAENVERYYSGIINADVSKAVISEAANIVRPFVEAQSSGARVPKPDRVDWSELNKNEAAVLALKSIYDDEFETEEDESDDDVLIKAMFLMLDSELQSFDMPQAAAEKPAVSSVEPKTDAAPSGNAETEVVSQVIETMIDVVSQIAEIKNNIADTATTMQAQSQSFMDGVVSEIAEIKGSIAETTKTIENHAQILADVINRPPPADNTGVVSQVVDTIGNVASQISKIQGGLADTQKTMQSHSQLLRGGFMEMIKNKPKLAGFSFKRNDENKPIAVVIYYDDGSSEEMPVT